MKSTTQTNAKRTPAIESLEPSSRNNQQWRIPVLAVSRPHAQSDRHKNQRGRKSVHLARVSPSSPVIFAARKTREPGTLTGVASRRSRTFPASRPGPLSGLFARRGWLAPRRLARCSPTRRASNFEEEFAAETRGAPSRILAAVDRAFPAAC